MTQSKFNPRTALILLFIVVTGALRVLFIYDQTLSPLSHFSPLGAMALFGGACFDRHWKAYSFPLLTLLLSDLFLTFTIHQEFRSGLLYEGWMWTYAAFALMTLTGRVMIKKPAVVPVLTAAIVCVLIHWIVSDIGVWLQGSLFPRTAAGFIQCLIAAIPYESSLLLGTVLYAGILFGGLGWLQQKWPAVQLHR